MDKPERHKALGLVCFCGESACSHARPPAGNTFCKRLLSAGVILLDAPSEPPRHGGEPVGTAAIKWGAVVVIVIAILWFLARYVIPLFG